MYVLVFISPWISWILELAETDMTHDQTDID